MRRPFFYTSLLVLLLLTSCNFPGLAKTTPSSSSSASSGLNLLVLVSGDVQLKRAAWSSYTPTSLGARLYAGDQIRPAKGASAVVLCEGLTQWTVPTGAPAGLNNGCPPSSQPVLKRGASRIGGTRGGSDPLIPYILSPRKTRLLNPTPTLRWNPVSGATSYTVQLTTDKVVWEATTSDISLVYPGTPALKPGASYLLSVQADSGKKSQDEGAAGLSFSLLTPDEARPVQQAVKTLAALNLSGEAQALALAQIYEGYNLMADAIEILTAQADQGTQVAAIYRMLGDLYLQSGANLQAQQSYQQAVQLAQAAGDIESQAAAQAGLGEADAVLGLHDEAAAAFQEALDNYTQLGDQPQIDALADRLKDLN
jgi:hypothetical protein